MPLVARDRGAPSRARIAVTAVFAAHAFLSGQLGPWIPALKARTGVDASGLGLSLTGFAVGLLLGTRIAGMVVRRVGARTTVAGGVVALAAGIGLLPLPADLVALTAVLAWTGLAAGVLDVAMNIEAVAVERSFGRRVMTAMHGTWSVALFAGAGVASLAIAAGVGLEAQLPVTAAVLVAASAPFLRRLPGPAHATSPAEGGGGRPPVAARRRVLLLCVIAAASFLVEGVAMDWSALFLRQEAGAAAAVGGLGVVAFSAGMAASRFVGDRLVGRFGQPAVVRLGAVAAVVAFGAMLLVVDPAVSVGAFAVAGLGIGPVVPLAFRSAAATERRGPGSALPIVVTAGYAGSIVGPIVVGYLADLLGLRGAFVVPLAAVATVAVAAAATGER
jgi:fucose permease